MALLTVRETAQFLNMSECWVRRHLAELPVKRLGRTIRIDSEQLHSRMAAGKSLEPERAIMPNRFQRGSVRKEGVNEDKWYGYWRTDTPEGKRRPMHVLLGTTHELPTKAAALRKLNEKMNAAAPPLKSSVTFGQLAQRWMDSEGTALGTATLGHYTAALRAYVLPKWTDRRIDTINREAIQELLSKQAKKYSRSSLKSLRLVVQMVL